MFNVTQLLTWARSEPGLKASSSGLYEDLQDSELLDLMSSCQVGCWEKEPAYLAQQGPKMVTSFPSYPKPEPSQEMSQCTLSGG